MRNRLFVAILALGVGAWAQIGAVPGVSGAAPLSTYSGAPTGSCSANAGGVDITTGNFYTCNGGSWIKVGPGAAVPTTIPVNAQTASYTVAAGDFSAGKIITVNDASASTVTLLATAPPAGQYIYIENIGAGAVTVANNTRNIDGAAASLTLNQNQGVLIDSDGTNYVTSRGIVGVPGTSGQLLFNNNGQIGAEDPVVSYNNPAESTASWTSATAANTAVTATLPQGSGADNTVIVTLAQGSTITAGQVTFEWSDTTGFATAYPAYCEQLAASPVYVNNYALTASTNAAFLCDVGGYQAFRVRLSTAIAGTATVNVGVQMSAAPRTSGVFVVGGTLNVGNTPNVQIQADASTNLAQVGGTAVALGQTTMASSVPVAIASNQGAVPVSESGSWSVSITGTPAVTVSGNQTVVGTASDNTANSTAKLPVIPAVANSAAPTYTSGDQVPLSTDTGGNLRVTCANCGGGTGGTAMGDAGSFTQGTTSITPVGGEYNSSPTSLTSGQAGAVLMTATRHMDVAVADPLPAGANTIGAVTVSGTPNVQIQSDASVNVAQIAGAAPSAANPLPVEQSDGANVLGTSTHPVRVDPTGTTAQPVSGTVGVSSLPALPAGSNAIGSVSVSNFPATQPVSGTVTANQGTAAAIAGAWPAKITDGTSTQVVDPCQAQARTFVPISITASTQEIAGTSGKQTYICGFFIVVGAADNVAVVEGTGTVCATGTAGMMGGPTAATGLPFGVNGGSVNGTGGFAIDKTATAADNVCLLVSGTAQVSGVLSYVQQ